VDKGVYEDLRRAILEYDDELAVNAANKVVENKLDALKAFDVMTEAIRQVGDGFGRGELYLPELIGAGETMSKVLSILEEVLKKSGRRRQSTGVVVVGTVYGDIHSIGKSIVASLFVAEGFEVHDVGVNVSPEKFVQAVKEYNANLLAMSALLTVTAREQKKVIELLKKDGIRNRVKVIVGGAAISQEFADSIGADGYDSTAFGGVKMARRLIGK